MSDEALSEVMAEARALLEARGPEWAGVSDPARMFPELSERDALMLRLVCIERGSGRDITAHCVALLACLRAQRRVAQAAYSATTGAT
ncbi:MAG: hypothetical protein IPK80_02825 [Nannocystis sp.]|nr:hypothetical protein [Nannocystis sp.]